MKENYLKIKLDEIYDIVHKTHNTILSLIYTIDKSDMQIILECSYQEKESKAIGCNIDNNLTELEDVIIDEKLKEKVNAFITYLYENKINDKETFYLFYNESNKTVNKVNRDTFLKIKEDLISPATEIQLSILNSLEKLQQIIVGEKN